MARKAKKARVPLKGEKPATTKAALAIKELLKTRMKMSVLTKRKSLLIKIIKEEGCGSAHGYRTYISHSPACTYVAHKKASDSLKLIAISGER